MNDFVVTIKTYLDQLLGSYTPVIDPVTGSVVAGTAGVDWSYVISGLLLLIIVYWLGRGLVNVFTGRR